MKQRSESWSKAAAPLAFGLALTMVIVSCGKSSSPVAPSASNGSAVQAEDVPTDTDTPTETETETETPGTEGCTPGYWKAPQHFDSWPAPYTPGTLFTSIDGLDDAFAGLTLLQVLELNGGGLSALGRHTVAALLNAASDDVDYGLSTTEIKARFNAAYPSGDIEGTKNVFEGLNEAGCPLN